MKTEALRALRQLLLGLYSFQELRIFLKDLYGPDLVDRLPESGDKANLAFAAVERLGERGLIGRRLFYRLRDGNNQRDKEIEAVAEACGSAIAPSTAEQGLADILLRVLGGREGVAAFLKRELHGPALEDLGSRTLGVTDAGEWTRRTLRSLEDASQLDRDFFEKLERHEVLVAVTKTEPEAARNLERAAAGYGVHLGISPPPASSGVPGAAESVRRIVRQETLRWMRQLQVSAEGLRRMALEHGDAEMELAAEILAAMENDVEVSDPQLRGLEQLVVRKLRPSLRLLGDAFASPGAYWPRLADRRHGLAKAARSVALVRVESSDRESAQSVGTAFLVGDALFMTSAEVARQFVTGEGTRSLLAHPERRATLELAGDGSSTGHVLEPLQPVMIHPYWDVALLRCSKHPPDREPLEMVRVEPIGLSNRAVVAVGHRPGDGGRDRYLSPGKLTGYSTILSGRNNVQALRHDCHPLGGSPGSPLLDLETGRVLAIHSSSHDRGAGFAVPSWQLAVDQRVRAAGVGFAPYRDPPSWLGLWSSVEPQHDFWQGLDRPVEEREFGQRLRRVRIAIEWLFEKGVAGPLLESDGEKVASRAWARLTGRKHLSVDEMDALSDFVIRRCRPFLDLDDTPPPPWEEIGPERVRGEELVPSVGRIVSDEQPQGYGTAIVLTPGLCLTAGHLGDQVAGWQNPRLCLDGEAKETCLPLAGTVFRHSVFDAALIALGEEAQAPLTWALATRPPNDLNGRPVFLCAYHVARGSKLLTLRFLAGKDWPQNREKWTRLVRRVSPGRVLGVGPAPTIAGGERFAGVGMLLHDCSSLPGSAGGPVVDLATGEILGVHFAGGLTADVTGGSVNAVNLAVPAWELLLDPAFRELISVPRVQGTGTG